jgi:hypothetical protein
MMQAWSDYLDRMRAGGTIKSPDLPQCDDIAEPYGWVNRTLDDDDLDAFVDTLVRRLA